MNRIDITPTIP